VSVTLSDAQARQLMDLVGGQIARLTGYRPPAEPAPELDPTGYAPGEAPSEPATPYEPAAP